MIDDQRAGRAETVDSLVDPDGGDPDWLWRSGGLVPWHEARVHVNAVGHASVAAVFEGLKAYLAADGERLLVFRLDDHLRRLHQSARICRIEIPWTAEELHTAVLEVLAANGYACDVYVRPWAYPAGIIREQMVPAGLRCDVVVDSWPFRSGLADERGCRAAVSSWLRVPDASAPPRAKAFSNYHNGRLALMEARENGHDWPIMLNERLKVSEGPAACVALVRDGRVITPALTGGLLESITRDTALTLLAEADVPVEVREVDRSELYVADEIFFMGTAWEILPVRAVDGLTVGDGTPGPLTTLVRDAYMRLVRGESTGHDEWLTELRLPDRA
ncbi:branched-chain-amino-acid transaminase [Actinomadura sp. NEAU-AAG7]|uniref:branched-chain-amino-acid transaminase n=1 Tax=Actinomadura sp. NEAU-AAG7 TaxID=2839640 RepID=UPI001BE3D605|nr:branched-chain-amino-acid transaminase [Actinomadura sp. NEAU-AAG7]MBT2210165.1 branched-chain-amino-acid transaminase [Actinomadura sp. NEAU-AAG7]